MGTPENQKEYGPSWYDVKNHILEVRKAHNRPITIELSVVETGKRPPYLYLTVVSYDVSDPNKHVRSTATGHEWPSGDWKTMPAMILALLFMLDEKLTDYEALKARQSAF